MATTLKIQDIVNQVRVHPVLSPVFNTPTGGSTQEPALTIANEVFQHIFGSSDPWKFNEILLPQFYTNSYQQDYALINGDGTSVENLGFLQSGDVLDINNQGLPKTNPQIEVVRQMPRLAALSYQPWAAGIPKFQVCWLYNNQLYYGTWGAAPTGNNTRGNNPQASQVITSPLGQGNSQPSNPISQIQDANGNLLVLTTYGTTGSSAPSLPANSAPGTPVTDGSVVWTVVDPLGAGIRIGPVPTQSGTVWQFNLRGQAKPPAYITSLSSTLAPIPDEYSYLFRQGFITVAYRYSPEEKVRARYAEEMAVWKQTFNEARIQSDREPESFAFVPANGIIAPIGNGCSQISPGNPWPWGY